MTEESKRMQAEEDNLRVMELLSRYLNETPAFISGDMVSELTACGVEEETAFSLLLAAAMGLDMEESPADMALYRTYFPHMLRRIRAAELEKNPYYRGIRFRDARCGSCSLGHGSYAPYEAFVCDDIAQMGGGRRAPQIGYFGRAFSYPALFEGDRLWMSVTPNEVNTMAGPLAEASGRVLAFGLGLGYFLYMAARKPAVSHVTVVEQNPDVIALFESLLLPQFPFRDKITIVQDDAFAFARAAYPKAQYDFTFTDLWHDVSDGLPLYLAMRALAPLMPAARHTYWIEKTLMCYLSS